MKIMIELDSLQEFQKIMDNGSSSLTVPGEVATEQPIANAQNAGSCASIDLNEQESVSPVSLFKDKNETLIYERSSLEHRDFENTSTAGQYLANALTGNPTSDFSIFSQGQVRSLANAPTIIPADQGSFSAGPCLQTGFNPN